LGGWFGLWAVTAGKYGVEVLGEGPGYEGLFGERGAEAGSGGAFEELVDCVAGKDSSVSDGFPDGRHGSVLVRGYEIEASYEIADGDHASNPLVSAGRRRLFGRGWSPPAVDCWVEGMVDVSARVGIRGEADGDDGGGGN
jgi:hypothetical protein